MGAGLAIPVFRGHTLIPFNDLAAQYGSVAGEVQEALERVFQRGWFILGEEVAAFEAEFASYLGTPFAVGVGSGTEALHLALRALGERAALPLWQALQVGDSVVNTLVLLVWAAILPGKAGLGSRLPKAER